MDADEIPEAGKEAMINHLDRLLNSREYPKTICPSEVARSMTTQQLRDADVSGWRDLMPAIRSIVWERKIRGEVEILQKGQPLAEEVTLETIRGPIRVRNTRDA